MQDVSPGEAFDPLDDDLDVRAEDEDEEYEEEESEAEPEDEDDESYDEDDAADDEDDEYGDEDEPRDPKAIARERRAARVAAGPRGGRAGRGRRGGGGDAPGDRLRERGHARARKGRKRFDIGNALAKWFSLFFKNLVPFTILSALFHLPLVVWNYVMQTQVHSIGSIVTLTLLGMLLSIVLTNVLTATLVFAVFKKLRNEPAPLGKCLSTGLSRLLPVVGVGFLTGLCYLVPFIPAVAIGAGAAATGNTGGVGLAILLGIAGILPFIILICGLISSVPAVVVERPGVLGALGRSWSLAKGYKGEVFVVGLVWFMFWALVSCLCRVPFLGAAEVAGETNAAKFIVEMAGNIIMAPAFSILSAVIYHDLRVQKEGIASDELAAIFD